MAAPSVPRFEDRNLVGICHLDVVDVDDVLSVGDEIRGNVADTVVLKEGKSWSRVYLDDDGGSLVETWKQDGGVQHSEAVISGAIAKDRLALMPHLWRMKGRRYLVVTTNRNGDQLLMGRPETPATASVPLRRTGDGDNMERDRNEYRVVFSLARRLPVPFYGGTAPEPPAPPGECAAASLSINSVSIGTVASGGSKNIPVVDIATLDPVGTWNAEEQRHEVDMGGGEECPPLCEQMDTAFAIPPEEGGDPVLTMALDLTGTDTLPVTGTTNGRPHYSNAAWGTFENYAEAYWTGSGWYVTDGNSVWTSTDDVATPDLIENWTGDEPYPVLTMEGGGDPVDVGAQQIVDCWDEEQLERIQELVCETPENGGAMTTDGTTPVITVPPGTDVPLPQSHIKAKDPSNDDELIAISNTELASGRLQAATQIPRREIVLTGGTGTGIFATAGRLLAGTLPTIPQQLNITWAAGAGDTLGVVLPASMQGVAFSFVSETGSNGTITVSVNNGSSFAAPPFTASTAKVIFRRTTTTSEHSALFATA
jgi:hypothetical protein